MLLTTTGRKTGQARTVPIVYLHDDQHYVVIATDDPAWYRNLKNTAQASVEIKGKTISVTGRDAAIEETPALWAKIVAKSPAFKSAQGKPNHILVILEPTHR